MYYLHSGYQTPIFGKNCVYYIRIFTVIVVCLVSVFRADIVVWKYVCGIASQLLCNPHLWKLSDVSIMPTGCHRHHHHHHQVYFRQKSVVSCIHCPVALKIQETFV